MVRPLPALTTDQGAGTLICSGLHLYLQRNLKQQTPPLIGRVTNLALFLWPLLLWVLVFSTGGTGLSVLAATGLQYLRSLVFFRPQCTALGLDLHQGGGPEPPLAYSPGAQLTQPPPGPSCHPPVQSPIPHVTAPLDTALSLASQSPRHSCHGAQSAPRHISRHGVTPTGVNPTPLPRQRAESNDPSGPPPHSTGVPTHRGLAAPPLPLSPRRSLMRPTTARASRAHGRAAPRLLDPWRARGSRGRSRGLGLLDPAPGLLAARRHVLRRGLPPKRAFGVLSARPAALDPASLRLRRSAAWIPASCRWSHFWGAGCLWRQGRSLPRLFSLF